MLEKLEHHGAVAFRRDDVSHFPEGCSPVAPPRNEVRVYENRLRLVGQGAVVVAQPGIRVSAQIPSQLDIGCSRRTAFNSMIASWYCPL